MWEAWSALSGHPSGWAPWRSHQGCVRAPGELNPGASMSTWAGARAGGAERGPLASKRSWGRAGTAVAISDAWKVARPGADKPCQQCALHPHRVVQGQSKCPCRVWGVWRWETLPEASNSLHQNDSSPLTAVKRHHRRKEALTKYFIALTDLPFLRRLLKMKHPLDLYLLQVVSRLEVSNIIRV